VRIAGWILLLAGLVLCVSIAWAPLGFLLMGVGLVALQVAEQHRRRPKLAVVADVGSFDGSLDEMAPPRAEQPVVHREIAPAPPRRVTRRFNRSPFEREAPYDSEAPYDREAAYDREAWRRLVESDPDLAQLTAVLADYGQQYIDELATAYLADPDKSRLGAIVDGIIAKAGAANPSPATNPPDDPKPAMASGPLPTETPAAEIEASPSAIVTAVPAQPASDPPLVDPPRSDRERSDIPITTADDDLTDVIKKFAPDSDFLRKN
jgi:hypothetical protein